MILRLFFPATLFLNCRGLEEGEEPSGRNALRLIQDRLNDTEFCKNRANLSSQFAASADSRFEFQKRSQFFISAHNETISVPAMRVSNPDRSLVGINR